MVARMKSSCDEAPGIAGFCPSFELAAPIVELAPALWEDASAGRERAASKKSNATDREFMRNCECTGRATTKKAAPFGANLFKEARWQESEEPHLGAVSGEETTGESRKH